MVTVNKKSHIYYKDRYIDFPFQNNIDQLPTDEFVNLTVYNVLGKTITTLVNEQKHTGSYEVIFDASVLSSGVYFYKLTAGKYINIKKMVITFA